MNKLLQQLVIASSFLSASVSAAPISFYSGIDINGQVEEMGTNQTFYEYEMNVAAFAAFSGLETQTTFKSNRVFSNFDVFTNGIDDVILGADISSQISMGFDSDIAKTAFDTKVTDKTFENNISNIILAGSPVLRVIGVDIEEEADQGRNSSETFHNDLFNSDNYGEHFVELNFDFNANLSSDLTMITQAMSEALSSFFIGGNDLESLLAIEQQSLINYDTYAGSEGVSGTFSRKLWFDSAQAATDALTFFENDTVDVDPNDGFQNGYVQDLMLNGNHPVFARSFSFSNVSQSQQSAVSVPEPSTFGLLGFALLALLRRR